MSILIFILVVLIVLFLVLYALEQVPITPPFNWLIRLLIVLIAVVIIAQKAGLPS
jgi:hypothetical protein